MGPDFSRSHMRLIISYLSTCTCGAWGKMTFHYHMISSLTSFGYSEFEQRAYLHVRFTTFTIDACHLYRSIIMTTYSIKMGFKKKSGETSRVLEASRSSKIKKNSSKTQAFTCPICLDTIKDASDDSTGEDAIVCEGRCNTCLHRKCADVSKAAYEAATISYASFYCPQCRLDTQEYEIVSLKRTIQQLVEDVHSFGDRLLPTTDADTTQLSRVNPSRTPSIMYSQVVKSQAGSVPIISYQISSQIPE